MLKSYIPKVLLIGMLLSSVQINANPPTESSSVEQLDITPRLNENELSLIEHYERVVYLVPDLVLALNFVEIPADDTTNFSALRDLKDIINQGYVLAPYDLAVEAISSALSLCSNPEVAHKSLPALNAYQESLNAGLMDVSIEDQSITRRGCETRSFNRVCVNSMVARCLEANSLRSVSGCFDNLTVNNNLQVCSINGSTCAAPCTLSINGPVNIDGCLTINGQPLFGCTGVTGTGSCNPAAAPIAFPAPLSTCGNITFNTATGLLNTVGAYETNLEVLRGVIGFRDSALTAGGILIPAVGAPGSITLGSGLATPQLVSPVMGSGLMVMGQITQIGNISINTDALGIQSLINAINAGFGTLIPDINTQLGNLVTNINGGFNTLTSNVNGALTTVTNNVNGALTTLTSNVNGGLSALTTNTNNALATVTANANAALATLTSNVNAGLGVLTTDTNNALGIITGQVNTALGTVFSTINSGVIGPVNSIVNTLNGVTEILGVSFTTLAPLGTAPSISGATLTPPTILGASFLGASLAAPVIAGSTVGPVTITGPSIVGVTVGPVVIPSTLSLNTILGFRFHVTFTPSTPYIDMPAVELTYTLEDPSTLVRGTQLEIQAFEVTAHNVGPTGMDVDMYFLVNSSLPTGINPGQLSSELATLINNLYGPNNNLKINAIVTGKVA